MSILSLLSLPMQLYVLTYDSLLTLQYYKSIDSMIVNWRTICNFQPYLFPES